MHLYIHGRMVRLCKRLPQRIIIRRTIWLLDILAKLRLPNAEKYSLSTQHHDGSTARNPS